MDKTECDSYKSFCLKSCELRSSLYSHVLFLKEIDVEYLNNYIRSVQIQLPQLI